MSNCVPLIVTSLNKRYNVLLKEKVRSVVFGHVLHVRRSPQTCSGVFFITPTTVVLNSVCVGMQLHFTPRSNCIFKVYFKCQTNATRAWKV